MPEEGSPRDALGHGEMPSGSEAEGKMDSFGKLTDRSPEQLPKGAAGASLWEALGWQEK